MAFNPSIYTPAVNTHKPDAGATLSCIQGAMRTGCLTQGTPAHDYYINSGRQEEPKTSGCVRPRARRELKCVFMNTVHNNLACYQCNADDKMLNFKNCNVRFISTKKVEDSRQGCIHNEALPPAFCSFINLNTGI